MFSLLSTKITLLTYYLNILYHISIIRCRKHIVRPVHYAIVHPGDIEIADLDILPDEIRQHLATDLDTDEIPEP